MPTVSQIKSSLPLPDIARSVERMERFNVVTGPTGIMGMVAICLPPNQMLREGFLENRARSTRSPRMPTSLPRERNNQRLQREARDRAYRSEPIGPIAREV